MYVRVRLEQGFDDVALLVPQQALQRTADGKQSLMLVRDNKIAQAPVTTGGAYENNWLITSGLKAGDVVVVEGFQKIRPGAPVQVSQWNRNGTPAQGGAPAAQPGAKPAEPGAQPGAKPAEPAPQPGAKPAEPAPQDKAAGQKS
jgi:membrane fusion protein (multidrug efflux system)